MLIRPFTALIGALFIVAISLVLMLGTFWIVDLAPLLFFVGTGVVYGVLSSQKSRNRFSSSLKILSVHIQEKPPYE